jgi:preprotein translocase subunit YajC
MYFFMFRPQSKKAKEHREMVAALKRGDRVVVASGILGVVSKIIDDAEIAVEIASGVEIKVVRSSVSQVISKKTPAEKDASDKPAVKKTEALKKKAAPRKSSVIKK